MKHDSYRYNIERDWPKAKPEPWEYIIWSILAMFVAFMCYAFYYEATHFEEREVGAVVMEHYVTADRHGARTYSTIIKTDDGFIEEVTGLGVFTAKQGGRVRVKLKREIIK